MRVLQVLHNHPPEFRGGVERYVEEVCAGLMARGHRVTVLCGSERSAERTQVEEETWRGVPVMRLVRRAGLRHPLDPFDPECVNPLHEILDRVRPDVLHVHHWWNLSDDLVRRSAARGHPTVVTLHDAFSTCALFFRLDGSGAPCDRPQSGETCGPCVGGRFGLDVAEVRWLAELRRDTFAAELRAAGHVLTPSRAHARVLEPHVPQDVDLHPLPLGAPLFDEIPPRPDPRPGRLRLIHFGNLSRLKGVEILARAVEEADPGGNAISLDLFGDVIEEGLDLGRARMHGSYTRDELPRLAAGADLAVFPSLARESYGIVVDEALRLGLPVLVSEIGALAERIGKRGVAFRAGDVTALAELLRSFLRDPERLRSLLEAAEHELPTPEVHAAELEAIYCKVRRMPLPPVDLETPLLRRISRFRERMGEVISILSGSSDGEEGRR